MIYLLQRDPKWVQVKLGQSQLTCGRFGCTTCCISMLSDYFGYYVNPGEFAIGRTKVLQNILQYTKDGLVIWQSLNIPKMQFEKRLRVRDDAAIIESLQDPNKAVMLEVDYSHWVVATRKSIYPKHYAIYDPLIKRIFNNTKAYGAITGSAHFIRK